MQYIQTQIGSLPVSLLCLEDATIVLQPLVPSFPVYLDIGTPAALIDASGVHIGDWGQEETYSYGTRYAYKEIPVLLAWLQRQGMINPV